MMFACGQYSQLAECNVLHVGCKWQLTEETLRLLRDVLTQKREPPVQGRSVIFTGSRLRLSKTVPCIQMYPSTSLALKLT